MNKSIEIILESDAQKFIDEYGRPQKRESYEFISASKDLVTKTEEHIGKYETEITNLEKNGAGTTFGGFDIVTMIERITFLLGSSGLLKQAYPYIKEWLSLKKSRKFHMRFQNDGKIETIDMTGYSFEEIEKIIKDKGQVSVEKKGPIKAAKRKKE